MASIPMRLDQPQGCNGGKNNPASGGFETAQLS